MDEDDVLVWWVDYVRITAWFLVAWAAWVIGGGL